MRVLVTDGDNRAALAVTRSLGRAGHDVIVGAPQGRGLAQASRYCVARAIYPDPVAEPDRFLEAAVELVAVHRADCILPVADVTTFIVTSNRHRFEPNCAVPFADAAAIERAADKIDIMETAERIGIPVPRSVIVKHADQIPYHTIPFPLVVKPWRSRIRTERGWASTSVSHAATPMALQRDLQCRAAHEFPVMLQERIDGPGAGVFACYRNGRPEALFSHRRLRERPPWGGVSVLSESVELPAGMSDFATRLLESIGWRGVAMVEFKIDSRDNQPKLMEVNGRFWGSLQLAIDSGVNFPLMLIDENAVTRDAAPASYRRGVRSRWLWGDFDAMLQIMFRWNGPSELRPSRSRAIWQFLKFAGPQLHYDNPKWDDVWPFVVETAQRFGVVANWLQMGGARRSPHVEHISTPLSTGGPDTDIRLAKSIGDVRLPKREWNALVSSAETNSIFQSHQWMQSWLDVYDHLHDPFFLVADVGGVPAAVAPLMVNKITKRQDRVVTFIGSGRADYCDFIAPRTEPAILLSLVKALLDRSDWDMIDLSNIPATSSTVEAFRLACQDRKLPFGVFEQYPCPSLIIEGRESEAQEVLDKPSLRRCQKKLQKAGKLVERDVFSASAIEPRLSDFFDQHVARWRGSGSPSLFIDDRNRRFYRKLTQALDDSGWLLFSSIELNDRPVAFHYGFDYNGAVIWYKPSFDPALAALSPGNVMVRHLIDYAISHRRRELDFTVGDEAFKRRFTNLTRRTLHLQVYRNSMVRLRHFTRELAEAASKTVRNPESHEPS